MDYIAHALYRKMVVCALAEGMKPTDFGPLDVSVDVLAERQAVPADQFFSLHERIDEVLEPGFSVRVGRQMKIEDYGVLGLSWRTCSRAGDLFTRSERYFTLLSNTYNFRVETGPEISKVYLLRKAHRRGIALSNEATFAASVVVLKAITEADINPVSVVFAHDPPLGMDSYTEVFACPVLFNQSDNYIAYRTEDLNRRTAKADKSINAFLVERVEEETRGIEVSPNKVAVDVENLIKDALPSGIPSIDQIGQYIGMSSRTLNRRLAEDGMSFRALIRRSQETEAKRLLLSTSCTIGEIAFQTGFSEQSAFNRAFKRWTGYSPTSFRKVG